MTLDDFIMQFGEQCAHQFEISDDVYCSFQKCSGDMNPLHIDEDYAKDKGFVSRVMYGNILNSFVSYFVGMCMPTPEVMLLKQDIIYLQPLYLNDKVDMNVTIEKSYPKFKMLDFKFTFRSKNILVARGHFQIKLV